MADQPLVTLNAAEAAIARTNGHPVYVVTQTLLYAAPGWNVAPTPTPVPPIPGNWKLVFEDDFTSLDLTKWTPYWFNDGTAMNNVACDASNVSVGPNGLSLKLSAAGAGSIISSNPGGDAKGPKTGFQFTYGYVEFEATFPDNADWCCGWLLGRLYPGGGEFDIAEQMGGSISSNYHYPVNGTDVGSADPSPVSGLLGTPHTFGLLWEPGLAEFYYDGKLHRTISGAEVVSQPQYLVFNHGASSATDASGAGSEFVVKYVRVWQLA